MISTELMAFQWGCLIDRAKTTSDVVRNCEHDNDTCTYITYHANTVALHGKNVITTCPATIYEMQQTGEQSCSDKRFILTAWNERFSDKRFSSFFKRQMTRSSINAVVIYMKLMSAAVDEIHRYEINDQEWWKKCLLTTIKGSCVQNDKDRP